LKVVDEGEDQNVEVCMDGDCGVEGKESDDASEDGSVVSDVMLHFGRVFDWNGLHRCPNITTPCIVEQLQCSNTLIAGTLRSFKTTLRQF
jgi:hypothetical protein